MQESERWQERHRKALWQEVLAENRAAEKFPGLVRQPRVPSNPIMLRVMKSLLGLQLLYYQVFQSRAGTVAQ